MIFGLALLASLALLLAGRRAELTASSWNHPPGSRLAWALSTAAVAAGSWPLLSALPRLLSSAAVLPADAATHAAVAHAIARDGLPHGWVSTFDGGFPIAVHYPAVGWLLSAAIERLGAHPVVALQAVALGAIVAPPFVALFFARAAGARPAAAVAGALAVAWLSPFQYFEGGWEPYLARGLFSQATAWPLAIGLGWAVATEGRPLRGPLVGALLFAAHPQIAVGALLVVGAGAISSWNRPAVERYVRAAVASAAVAIFVFGPGVLTLGVPFGWPPMDEWKRSGFPPGRLLAWLLDGSLLDDGRAAIVSSAWLFSLASLVPLVRRRSCRVALACSAASLGATLSGPLLLEAGRLGELLLSFLQPLRVLPTVPLVAALSVAIAAEELLALAEAWAARAPWPRARLAPQAALGLMAALSAPAALAPRARWMRERLDYRRETPSGGQCGDDRPGRRVEAIAGWIASLDRGRLDFEGPPSESPCAFARGVHLASPLPLGRSAGVGAHVGVNAVAFARLRPAQAGSVARAEALGVRFLVHPSEQSLEPGWRRREEAGGFALSEREGGTDAVGVGCAASIWRGRDAELRAALFADLDGEATVLSDPRRLTLLEPSREPLSRDELAAGDCSTSGARVSEQPREPGAYQADVEAPSAVDVVIRASAYPTWRVSVDGAPAPWRMVAPGFPSVRVPAGKHRVEAVASLPRGYLLGLLAMAAVIGAAGWGKRLTPAPGR